MKKYLSFFFSLISFFIIASLNSLAFAQMPWSTRCVQQGDVATIQGLECIFRNVVNVAITLIGLVTFIMIIIGSFLYLTSGGEPKSVDKAKTTLTLGIAGLVLAIASWLILNFISTFTGVTAILNFRVGLQ